jgi:hypothetical protein
MVVHRQQRRSGRVVDPVENTRPVGGSARAGPLRSRCSLHATTPGPCRPTQPVASRAVSPICRHQPGSAQGACVTRCALDQGCRHTVAVIDSIHELPAVANVGARSDGSITKDDLRRVLKADEGRRGTHHRRARGGGDMTIERWREQVVAHEHCNLRRRQPCRHSLSSPSGASAPSFAPWCPPRESPSGPHACRRRHTQHRDAAAAPSTSRPAPADNRTSGPACSVTEPT